MAKDIKMKVSLTGTEELDALNKKLKETRSNLDGIERSNSQEVNQASLAAAWRVVSIVLSGLKIIGTYSLKEEQLRKLERELPRLRALIGRIGLDEEIEAVAAQGNKARERRSDTMRKYAMGKMISPKAPVLGKLFFPSQEDLNAAEAEYLEYLVRFKEVNDRMLHAAEVEFKEGRIGFAELEKIYQTIIAAEQNTDKRDALQERLTSLIERYSKRTVEEKKEEQKLKEATLKTIDVSGRMPAPEFASVPDAKTLFAGQGLDAQKIAKVNFLAEKLKENELDVAAIREESMKKTLGDCAQC